MNVSSITADDLFKQASDEIGYSFDGELVIGGNYVSLARDDNTLYVSGQIPRVGNQVMYVGRVGESVSLEDAQHAAKLCIMRALAILKKELGTLQAVKRVLRIAVFVQCTVDFTLQSEVADGASGLLHRILGDAGRHTRTSVGVYQLPKNASVELDLIASCASTS